MYFELKKFLIICLIASLAISMLSGISAAEITIDSSKLNGVKTVIITPCLDQLSKSGTLVIYAEDGDTISLQNGEYSSKFIINGDGNGDYKDIKSITIKGKGSNVVLKPKEKCNIFSCMYNMKISIENIKFTNAKDTAIKTVSAKETIVKNCVFTNGGDNAITASSKSDLKVENCNFTNNKGKLAGGAIFGGLKTNIIVTKCTFINNKAKIGGAISISSGGNLIVKNSIFTNNYANFGGAISIRAPASIINSKFTNNKAVENGGAINVYSKLTKIENSIFNKNIAGKKYNAIDKYGGGTFTTKNVKITPKDGTKV